MLVERRWKAPGGVVLDFEALHQADVGADVLRSSKESMAEVSPTCTLAKLSCRGGDHELAGRDVEARPVRGMWIVLPWPPLLLMKRLPLSFELVVGE